MAIDDALHMLATEYWDSVWSALNPDDRSQLLDAAAGLAIAGPDEIALNQALLRMLRVLRDVLPDEHAVLEAADETYRLATAPPVDWRPVTGALSEQVAAIVRESVRGRLQRSPALTTDQVRSAGCDPAEPSLIRLDSDSGDTRFPAFQFDHKGQPIEIVLRINERLGAGDDPWGVADWWLGENAWLDVAPADLIGSGDDRLLAAADAAAHPGWW
jgi:hypothetical protein